MSILTQLLRKEITWGVAKDKVEAWASALTKNNPIAAQLAGALLTSVKQAASDSISLGQTALAGHLIPFVQGLEPGLDAVFAKYLGKAAPIASDLTHDAIDQITKAAKDQIDAWSLKAKAELKAPAP